MARQNRRQQGEGKPETFTFLGFTHYCGENSASYFVVWRRTAAQRMTAKLQQIKQELRRRMHVPKQAVGEWLKQVVTGYYRYHAVPGNLRILNQFRWRVGRLWWQALRRRTQRHRITWQQLLPCLDRWIPRAHVLHPYPNVRFNVCIQSRSRMR